jgi:hypothetical protein
LNRAQWAQLVAAAVAAALAAWWFATQTEWVEITTPVPLRGEAARKPYYAALLLLRRLGYQVVERPNLQQWPPAGATLLLTSGHWSMFPGRAAALGRWVEQGGHLVLPRWRIDDDEDEEGSPGEMRWLPMQSQDKPRQKKGEPPPRNDDPAPDEPAASAPAPARASLQLPRPGARCRLLHERDTRPAAFGEPARWRICSGYSFQTLKPRGAEALWALDGPQGAEVLRVAHGRGDVTVLAGGALPLHGEALTQGDNGVALLAALGPPPRGTVVWLVAEETRPALLAWLWRQAWIVIVLGGLALAAALWRGGTRFGPLAARPPLGRRSLGEQIRGTAEFIWHRGPAALHAAQVRALDEQARRRVRGYHALDRGAKAQALSRATGLPADALGRALDGRIKRPRQAWPPVLALLEEARRRLAADANKPANP